MKLKDKIKVFLKPSALPCVVLLIHLQSSSNLPTVVFLELHIILLCQENGTFHALQDIRAAAHGGLLQTHDSFGLIRLGDTSKSAKLVGVHLKGPDVQAVTLPLVSSVGSLEAGGEMAELYWMAPLRRDDGNGGSETRLQAEQPRDVTACSIITQLGIR